MATPLSPAGLGNLSLAVGGTGGAASALQQLVTNVNSSFRNIPQATPPVAAPGTNAGSGATVTYVAGTNATDNAGQMVVTTGTGASAGQVAAVTYMTPIAISPIVNLMPANSAAATPAYGTYIMPTTVGSGPTLMYTGFTVNTVGAPTSSVAHNWNYTVLPGL
jgi:hypothetical protein